MIHSGQGKREQALLHQIRSKHILPVHGGPHQQHLPTDRQREKITGVSADTTRKNENSVDPIETIFINDVDNKNINIW